MKRAKAESIVRALLPKMPGNHVSYVAAPLGALEALLREPPLSRTPLADVEVSAVLEFGAAKHAEELTEAGRSPGAWYHLAKAGKHLGRFLLGQTADPETGLHPLAHVAARNLLALETILGGRHAAGE